MNAKRTPERAPRSWPRYMTARVAADYADASVWTIRRNVRPCGRRGRAFVYAIEDVERWMCGQPIGGEAPSSIHESLERIRGLSRGGRHEVDSDLADRDPVLAR